MKKTILSVFLVGIALLGYHMTRDYSTEGSYNTLHAATVSNWNYNGQLPLDVQLDLAKSIKPDTVVIHDTVTVNNIKYVRVPVPRHTTDTIFVPIKDLDEVNCVAVKNRNPGDREEYSLDSIRRGIVLIVDGTTVYTSKNENHSGGDSEEPMSADEP